MKLRYPITIIIISINVLVFGVIAWQLKDVMMNTSSSVQALIGAGANLNPLTLGGEPWRILTATFLHFGIIHLAVNMYALWSLGTLLEPAIGPARFIVLYLICGLAASIASLIFNVYVISAGASGAIFGLYGYQLGAELISAYHDRSTLNKVLLNFGIFVLINAVIAGQVAVDMAGHIGGAIAGIIIALCHFKLKMLKSPAAMTLVLILIPFILFILPKDQVKYYQIFQRVLTQEQHITTLFREEKNTQALSDSLQKSQTEWRSIQQSLWDLQRVPSATIAEDTATLSKYISLRNREINYRLRVLQESYIYFDSLEIVSQQFDSLPKLRQNLNFLTTAEEEIKPDTAEQQKPQPSLQPAQVYYDKDWKEIQNIEEAVYYRYGTKDSLGRWQGPVRDYYKNGDIQMKGSYVNDLRDGVFIYYTDHRTHSSAGRYEKERSVGKWENFHWNGKLKSEVYHGDRFFTKTVLDSLGNVQVSEGNGNYKSWHSNGVLAEEGSYSKGLRTGYWFGYHDNGKPYYKEMYRDNRLVSGVSIGKGGKKYVYDESSELPFPIAGFQQYQSYLQKNQRPCTGDSTDRVVKVLFSVGTDGSLWDFVILEGLSPACDAEAIRLVKEGPSWRPALLHGDTKIVSQGYVEVKF